MDTSAGQDAPVSGVWTLTFCWKKSVLTHHVILLPALPVELLHIHVNLQSAPSSCPPSLSIPPPSGGSVVRTGFVASSSRAWSWVTWPPPTILALRSCHHGNVSILTNMLWHLWPSSPPFATPFLFLIPSSFPPFMCCHHYSVVFHHSRHLLVCYAFQGIYAFSVQGVRFPWSGEDWRSFLEIYHSVYLVIYSSSSLSVCLLPSPSYESRFIIKLFSWGVLM